MAIKVMPRQGGTISGEDSFDSLGKQTRQETEKSMSSKDETESMTCPFTNLFSHFYLKCHNCHRYGYA